MNLILLSICCFMLVGAEDLDMPPDLGPVPQPEGPPAPVGPGLDTDDDMQQLAEPFPEHYGGRGGRGGRGKECRDERNQYYCNWVAEQHKCDNKRMGQKCRKTCRYCEECEDISYNCIFANPYRCAIDWFGGGCRKSCNLCQTKTTTPEPTEECKDISYNCKRADRYRCSIYWFSRGCEKTCGLCKAKTTLPPSTTPTTMTTTTPRPTTTTQPMTNTTLMTTDGITTPESECKNDRDDCDTFFDWYCDTPSIRSQCKKFCKVCGNEEETTNPIPTTAEATTTRTTRRRAKCFTTETTTTTTTEMTTLEPTTSEETTGEMETTEMPEPKPTFMTETTAPKPCVDTDEKNCHTWESIGLCYSPKFRDDMKILCPLSCQLC